MSIDPYAEVWLDGKPIGQTPLDLHARVGGHRLRLVNKDLGIDKSVSVTVNADAPTRIEESWSERSR